jgi:hypothetical protein
MKWCFLVNDASLLMEFLGKFAHQATKEGEECIVAANSKIAEYTKKKYFPKNIRFLSKIDWCIKNYQRNQQEFGDLSWKEFFPDFDRYKLSSCGYEGSIAIVTQLYQFFDFIFQEEKPDVVVHEPPANLFSEVAYHFCRKNNIIYLGLIGSRIDGRIDVFDLEHTCSKYEKTFREINYADISGAEKKFEEDFIKKFLSHRQLPAYLKNYSSSQLDYLKRYVKREKERLRPWALYFLNRKRFSQFDYESESILKHELLNLWDGIKRRFKRFIYKDIFNSIGETDNFFLFPLHVQPEASTLVLATYFCDQLNTIKNIAFSLPFPYKLYVKEHPMVGGDRPRGFYRELKQIPNVVLIHPRENVENLIKKSQGVITLTSTIGLEAALAGKPVYVLGNVFYSYHPLCQKVNSFEELKQKIQMDLNKKPAIKNLEEINLRFILSYFKNTIAGDMAAASDKNDTNDYKAIYKEIKRIFLYGKTNFI